MTRLVDDEVLESFAVVGRPREAGVEIRRRYGSLVDRFTVSSPTPLSLTVRRELLAGIRGPAAVTQPR
jgi:hypothetical protein